MPIPSAQLIDVAITQGLVDAETVSKLRIQSRRERSDLLDLLTTHSRFPISTLYRALAETKGLNFVDPNDITLPMNLIKRIPRALLQRRQVLPVSENGNDIQVATSNPDDQSALGVVERIIGQPVTPVVAEPSALEIAIGRVLSDQSPGTPSESISPGLQAADAIALLDKVFKEAFLRRASDIHIEPQEEGVRVRLRVDGRLHVFIPALNPEEGAGLLSRIKVLAGLDIAEQRAPQDGGFTHHPPFASNLGIDIRVATSPTRWGERATLRLLGLETEALTLTAIGMRAKDLQSFRSIISRPYGIILLTGPTGSGKTTTLYAALREINTPDTNILTVEDPIEYVISGISQVEVGEKVNFAKALRSFLRHDPDVLLVGEIRDSETVDVALKASMTGHLVFSTLHTHSACSAVSRLVDIGCERYLLASSLTAVIAQRLVRRLCQKCALPEPVSDRERSLLGLDSSITTLLRSKGCSHCLGTGYRGRIGVFETLWITPELSDLIAKGGNEAEIRETAANSFTSLWQDGRVKVVEGTTTLEEILKVAVPEE